MAFKAAIAEALRHPCPATPKMANRLLAETYRLPQKGHAKKSDTAMHAKLGAPTTAHEVPRAARLWLHFYRRTKEPLYAFAAIELWPTGRALPADLMQYLKSACQEFFAAVRKELREKEPAGLKVEATLAKVFGLRSGSRKPSAIKRVRTDWEATEVAQEYEAIHDRGEKSEVVVQQIADRRTTTTTRVWRMIKRGRELLDTLD